MKTTTPKNSQLLQRINHRIDAWFTQPEVNAAGSAGLFRIVYALFYLWHLSVHSSVFLSGMPSFFVEYQVYAVRYLFPGFGAAFSPSLFYFLDSLLVAALVLLAFGYKTRWATAAVLLIGSFLEALSASVDGKRTLLPLVFYIPFFMLVVNAWAHTYSLDALLSRRSGKTPVSPRNSSWQYFLPARAILVALSIWFLHSAIFKVAFGGAWLSHADMMANFFLNRNVEAAVYDLPQNGLAPFIAQNPLIYLSIHATTLLFESLFFLSVINRKIRELFLAMALLFHAVNAIWLVVTVTPIFIVYCIFINWQSVKDFLQARLFSTTKKRSSKQTSPSSQLIKGLALFLATLIGLLWFYDLKTDAVGIRALLNLYGLLNWRTFWIPVLPVSVIWLFATVLSFRQSLKSAKP